MSEQEPIAPRKTALALGYDAANDAAPKLTAKGSGLVAERILELAEEHGIPVHEDPDLVVLLAQLNVGTEIPENLYRAIAEVLAFVYQLNASQRETNRTEPNA